MTANRRAVAAIGVVAALCIVWQGTTPPLSARAPRANDDRDGDGYQSRHSVMDVLPPTTPTAQPQGDTPRVNCIAHTLEFASRYPLQANASSDSTQRGPRLVQAVLYNGEHDMLKIRLYEQHTAVDLFIVVETKTTFRGGERPTRFDASHPDWLPYRSKLQHVVFEFNATLAGTVRWYGERLTRNQLHNFLVLKVLEDKDIVFVSDADEIVRSSVLHSLKSCPMSRRCRGGVIAALSAYYYDFGRLMSLSGWELSIFEFRKASSAFSSISSVSSFEYSSRSGLAYLGERLPRFRTPCKVMDAGWHISWGFKTIEEYQDKLRSFSHYEFDTPETRGVASINKSVCEGRDLLLRNNQTEIFITPASKLRDLPKLLLDRPDDVNYLLPFRCQHTPLLIP